MKKQNALEAAGIRLIRVQRTTKKYRLMTFEERAEELKKATVNELVSKISPAERSVIDYLQKKD